MYNRLKSIEFVRHVTNIMTGTIASQIIVLLASPLITRLYSPENFAMLGLYLSVVAVVSKVSSLCYERAIVLPEDEANSYYIVIVSLVILFVVSLSVYLLLIGNSEQISNLINNAEFGHWINVISLGIFFTGLANIGRYYLIRRKCFTNISVSRVIESFLSAGLKILLGFIIGMWTGGLLIGTLAGTMVAATIISINVFGELKNSVESFSLDATIMNVISRYRKFPLFASWNALLNVASLEVVIFILSALFNPVVVGLYSFATRILRQPIVSMSEAVAQVYFGKAASQLAGKNMVGPGLRKVILILGVSGFLPFLILGLYGNVMVSYIFGDSWYEAGQYVRILSPWFFVLFVLGPINSIYEVYEKQDVRLYFNLTSAILRVGSVFSAYYLTGSIYMVLLAFVVVNIIMDIMLGYVGWKLVSKHDKTLVGI